MLKRYHYVQTSLKFLLGFFCALLLLSSCARTFNIKSVQTDEFPDYISKYEQALDKDISMKKRNVMLKRLSDLYSCHNNPKPNYKKAYRYLNMYAENIKPRRPSHEVMDKLNMLSILVKLQDDVDDLGKNIKGLESIDNKIENIMGK